MIVMLDIVSGRSFGIIPSNSGVVATMVVDVRVGLLRQVRTLIAPKGFHTGRVDGPKRRSPGVAGINIVAVTMTAFTVVRLGKWTGLLTRRRGAAATLALGVPLQAPRLSQLPRLPPRQQARPQRRLLIVKLDVQVFPAHGPSRSRRGAVIIIMWHVHLSTAALDPMALLPGLNMRRLGVAFTSNWVVLVHRILKILIVV